MNKVLMFGIVFLGLLTIGWAVGGIIISATNIELPKPDADFLAAKGIVDINAGETICEQTSCTNNPYCYTEIKATNGITDTIRTPKCSCLTRNELNGNCKKWYHFTPEEISKAREFAIKDWINSYIRPPITPTPIKPTPTVEPSNYPITVKK